MLTVNKQTERTKYVWMDGEYCIYFCLGENAYEYQKYYGGIVIPV